MEQPSEHQVIDWLLATLSQKGASGFNVYFDLEEQYGSSFASEKASFFEDKLKYYKLTERDPQDQILRLTFKGELIVKKGGWLLFVEEHRKKILREARLKAHTEVEAREVELVAESGAGLEGAISEPQPKSRGLLLSDLAVFLFILFTLMCIIMYNDFH